MGDLKILRATPSDIKEGRSDVMKVCLGRIVVWQRRTVEPDPEPKSYTWNFYDSDETFLFSIEDRVAGVSYPMPTYNGQNVIWAYSSPTGTYRRASGQGNSCSYHESWFLYGGSGDEGGGTGSDEVYYQVSAVAAPSDGGEISGAGEKLAGSNVSLKATPSSLYFFEKWVIQVSGESEPSESTANPYVISNISADVDAYAVFKKKQPAGGDVDDNDNPGGDDTPQQYTVSVVNTLEGSGSATGEGTYDEGSDVVISATANSGYTFIGFVVDGGDMITENPYTIKNIQSDHFVSAVFSIIATPNQYGIQTSLRPAGAGTVSGSGLYDEGATASISATANSGYVFDHWEYDPDNNGNASESTSNPLVFSNLSANHYVVAVFEEARYYYVQADCEPTEYRQRINLYCSPSAVRYNDNGVFQDVYVKKGTSVHAGILNEDLASWAKIDHIEVLTSDDDKVTIGEGETVNFVSTGTISYSTYRIENIDKHYKLIFHITTT